MRYAVVIERAGGNYGAYVPDLPGCIATGATVAEVETAIRAAIELHIEGMREDGLHIPPGAARAEYVEVGARNSNPSRKAIEMTKDQLFVERRPQGDYAVRRPNSERASAIAPTQSAAIERAKELQPGTRPLVERVRFTEKGSPDKWRKP